MSDDVAQRVKTLIVNHMELPAEQVVDGASLTKDLDMDSLDAMDLVMVLGEEFKITIPTQDIEKIKTVGDLIHAVESQL